MKSNTLSGSYSLDSGVLIEMLAATPLGQLMNQCLLSDSVIAHTSYLNLSEAEYILCRKVGHELSRSKVENLLRSNYLNVIDMEQLHAIAAQTKCERSLALADCYSLATAKFTKSKALFAFKEEELIKEINKTPGEVEIEFLEDAAPNPATSK